MLLEQIQRYDKKQLFKLVNVEKVLSKGLKLPSEVHCVPTLMISSPERRYFFGKQLFDYLLLPNKGILFQMNKPKPSTSDIANISPSITNEPLAFTFGAGISGDSFSFIDENTEKNINDNHKRYVWSSIQDNGNILTADIISNLKMEEGRSKHNLPDVSQLRAERDLDIQNHLNTTTLPPPSSDS
jgi:hypothetical protein